MSLRSNPHASSSNQLKLFLLDRFVGEEPVNEVDGEEDGLRVKLELVHDFYQPINEDGAHFVSKF